MQNTPDNDFGNDGNDIDLSASGRPIGGIYATKKRKNKLMLPLLLLVLIVAGGVAYMMFGQSMPDTAPVQPPVAQEMPVPAGDISNVNIEAPPQPEVIENAATPGMVPADGQTPGMPPSDATVPADGQMPGMVPSEETAPAQEGTAPTDPATATPPPTDGMGAVQEAVPQILPPTGEQAPTGTAIMPAPESTTAAPTDPTTQPAGETSAPAVENPDMTAPIPVPAEPETPPATQEEPDSSSQNMPLVGPQEDFVATPNAVNPVTTTLQNDPAAAPPPMELEAAQAPVSAAPTQRAPDVSGTTAGEVAILQNLGAVGANVPVAAAAAPADPSGDGTQLGAAPPSPKPAVVQAQIRDLPPNYFTIEKAAEASDPSARIAAGKRAMDSGRTSSAVTMFDQLYSDDPTDTRVLAARAVALQKSGRLQEAMSAYEELLKIEPANLNALTSLLGLLRTQNSDLALEQLLRLRQAYPDHAGIAAQLGIVYGDRGQLDDAIRFLGVANSLEPMNPVFKFNMAVVMDKLGNTVEAESFYRQALELDSRYNTERSAIPRQAIENRISSLQ